MLEWQFKPSIVKRLNNILKTSFFKKKKKHLHGTDENSLEYSFFKNSSFQIEHPLIYLKQGI